MNTYEEFQKNGFVVLNSAIDLEKIDKYNKLWEKNNSQKRDDWGRLVGWGESASYVKFDEIKDILCSDSIFETFDQIKVAVALHLDITYNTSTDKSWHQDCCLPNREAGDHYIGVWVALEDVSPEAGPFEIAVGSHKWDIDYYQIYEQKEGGRTHKHGVNIYDFFAEQIKERRAEIFTFLPKKGDALIWHGYTVHRGAVPENRQLTRKSLIGHYCNFHSNYEQETKVDYEVARKELEESAFEQWGSGFFFKAPMDGYDA